MSVSKIQKSSTLSWPIFSNENEPIKLRIAALLQILSIADQTPGRILDVHNYITRSDNGQLKKFWHTTIKSLKGSEYNCCPFCLYDLKEYECGLRIDELSVKCLLYADDQVVPAAVGVRAAGDDRCRNSDVKERCDLKEDVVTRIERVMARFFRRKKFLSKGDVANAARPFIASKPKEWDRYISRITKRKFNVDPAFWATGNHMYDLSDKNNKGSAYLQLIGIGEPSTNLPAFAYFYLRTTRDGSVVDDLGIHIDVIVKIHGKTIYAVHLNHTALSGWEGKELQRYVQDFLHSGSHINQQLVSFPMQVEQDLPTEFGTPVTLQNTMTSLSSLRGGLSASWTSDRFTFETDLTFRYRGTALTSLSAVGPVILSEHTARAQQSVVIQLPIKIKIDTRPDGKTLRRSVYFIEKYNILTDIRFADCYVHTEFGKKEDLIQIGYNLYQPPTGVAVHGRAQVQVTWENRHNNGTNTTVFTIGGDGRGVRRQHEDEAKAFTDCDDFDTISDVLRSFTTPMDNKIHYYYSFLSSNFVVRHGMILMTVHPSGSCGYYKDFKNYEPIEVAYTLRERSEKIDNLRLRIDHEIRPKNSSANILFQQNIGYSLSIADDNLTNSVTFGSSMLNYLVISEWSKLHFAVWSPNRKSMNRWVFNLRLMKPLVPRSRIQVVRHGLRDLTTVTDSRQRALSQIGKQERREWSALAQRFYFKLGDSILSKPFQVCINETGSSTSTNPDTSTLPADFAGQFRVHVGSYRNGTCPRGLDEFNTLLLDYSVENLGLYSDEGVTRYLTLRAAGKLDEFWASYISGTMKIPYLNRENFNLTLRVKEHNGLVAQSVDGGHQNYYKSDKLGILLEKLNTIQLLRDVGIYRKCTLKENSVQTFNGSIESFKSSNCGENLVLAECTQKPRYEDTYRRICGPPTETMLKLVSFFLALHTLSEISVHAREPDVLVMRHFTDMHAKFAITRSKNGNYNFYIANDRISVTPPTLGVSTVQVNGVIVFAHGSGYTNPEKTFKVCAGRRNTCFSNKLLELSRIVRMSNKTHDIVLCVAKALDGSLD
ncbi:hypothetical protein EVAR_58447_1 [Eumeta japonica]|uniref:Vitellinogen open beta-sheet domain-containing protein n=1 Tax=Eumeta variegata TaxID=151549 RepID=A0A4C1Z5Q2_EUMVA|nr:hypothetical protein EVAR_58447_1 [Eumeta japonica]